LAGGAVVIDVRAIRVDDWPQLRAIRLEALVDTPSAYSTTYDEAVAFPDSLWIERATASVAGVEQTTVVGFDGDRAVALAIGLLREQHAALVTVIVSVYVTRSVRGTGTADRMFPLIHAWGEAHGSLQASLWVEETNARAIGFYERIGYTMTLDRARVPNDSGLFERRMKKTLNESG
jgi:GNAT superfamily N-acetyltransferase